MADIQNWYVQVQRELSQAEAARAAKNEGMARVCARRAAGIAVGAYLQHKGLPLPGPSALDRLNFLANLPDIPADWRQLSYHLVTRVNQEFQLPIQADLVGDSRKLANALLAEIDASEGN
jgi:hypothetical protein